MEEIKNWCSVKKFSDREIRKQKLEKIFDLTTNAPTAFNLQPYRFVILDSDEAMQKAVDSAIPTNKWIQHADKIAVVIGFEDIDRNSDKVLERKLEEGRINQEKAENLKQMYKRYKNRDEEFLTAWITRNTIIPTAFFMLACRSEGIGSCPVRGFKQQELSERLDLENDERPILLIPIGYPKEEGRNWRRNGEKIFEIR